MKVLEEEGFRPGFLCNTIEGSMDATFCAFGMPPEEIRKMVEKVGPYFLEVLEQKFISWLAS